MGFVKWTGGDEGVDARTGEWYLEVVPKGTILVNI